MSKWIAEFDLEDGDTMPEHMDLEYKGAKIDFHCRPKLPKEYTDVTAVWTNKEWTDFLSEKWHVSRSIAKKMLHAMVVLKKEDNLNRKFNEGDK